ncbi:MAG: metallophosphoesterase [Oscillospiraceae bacterium]|nr:metallophosphoesterase [Oscillospiraceae bacterium]
MLHRIVLKRAVLLTVLLFYMSGFASSVASADTDRIPPGIHRIVVASDLHLNPDNRPDGSQITQSSYNMELTDAMLWEAEHRAEILLLTGDLVHSGRWYRHEALVEKLHAAEEAGLRIYVLPGNHDLAPVTQTEFAALYADFGYAEAYSRDESSLSYCIISDDLMLLMMDTGGYPLSAFDLPYAAEDALSFVTDRYAVSGPVFLSDRTLRWAAAMIAEAQARQLRVICAGHYNLLSPPSLVEGSGYYIYNGSSLTALLQEAKVPLYLSGHMHLRGVYQENGLTELMTECLTSYPVSCGILKLDGDNLRYDPLLLDVDTWAASCGQSDPVLLHFSDWQETQRKQSAEKTVLGLASGKAVSKAELSEAVKFFSSFLYAYWHGALYQVSESLQTLPGYTVFSQIASDSSYGPWVRGLLLDASPLLAGFDIPFEPALRDMDICS